MSDTDLLDRIDELTTPTGHCRQCGHQLGERAPSDDFCGEACAHRWARLGVEPHVEVHGWRLPEREASVLYFLARTAEAIERTTVMRPTGPFVLPWTPLYVAPGRTDDPFADALVCGVAAMWARRIGWHEEAVVAQRMADEAWREALTVTMQQFSAQVAAFGRAATEALGRLGEQFSAMTRSINCALSKADMTLQPGARAVPDEDPKARALRLRQQRNTGPAVHADARRNRRD